MNQQHKTTNRVLNNNDVVWAKKIISNRNYETRFPHGDLWGKDDAMVKWMSVIEQFERIGKNNLKVIDLGCGTGCTPHIISDMGNEVIGVDNFYEYHFCKGSKMTMVKANCFDYLKSIEDATYDVAIDVCAVTHFDTRGDDEIGNYGWKTIAEEVYRILKHGGKFLLSSDCFLSSDKGEFIKPSSIIKLVESSGLKLDEEYQQTQEEIANFKVMGFLNVVSLTFIKQ